MQMWPDTDGLQVACYGLRDVLVLAPHGREVDVQIETTRIARRRQQFACLVRVVAVRRQARISVWRVDDAGERRGRAVHQRADHGRYVDGIVERLPHAWVAQRRQSRMLCDAKVQLAQTQYLNAARARAGG